MPPNPSLTLKAPILRAKPPVDSSAQSPSSQILNSEALSPGLSTLSVKLSHSKGPILQTLKTPNAHPQSLNGNPKPQGLSPAPVAAVRFMLQFKSHKKQKNNNFFMFYIFWCFLSRFSKPAQNGPEPETPLGPNPGSSLNPKTQDPKPSVKGLGFRV